MGYIKFKKKKTVTKVIVSEESPHVIRITGDNLTVNTKGFRLYLDADCKYPLDNGEYAAYTTLYREGDGWYELSDDGSVYIEPVAPVQPEPTEEELAEQARQQQISQVTAQIDGLKAQIAASDYKVIKTYEYTLLGKQTEGNLNEKKMSTMHDMYPKVVTISYMAKARRKGQVGKVNVDCSGLIAGYRQLNIGSYQLYQTAYTRMPIAKINDFAVGTVLWKSGHVGVYIGKVNGVPMCIEAKGINYGTVMSKVSATKWVYGLTFKNMDYTYDVKVPGTWKGTNPYTEPTMTVTSKAQASKKNIKVFISAGEGVKWIQWELMEAGLLTEDDIDGICGRKTVAAIIKYQQSCKITADGLAGKTTRKYLVAA